jgi:hypothetical protein
MRKKSLLLSYMITGLGFLTDTYAQDVLKTAYLNEARQLLPVFNPSYFLSY